MRKYLHMTPKNPHAVALGRKGGKKYAENTSPEERKQQARKAVQARWAKQKKRGNHETTSNRSPVGTH